MGQFSHLINEDGCRVYMISYTLLKIKNQGRFYISYPKRGLDHIIAKEAFVNNEI